MSASDSAFTTLPGNSPITSRLRASAGVLDSFLNDVARIAARTYEPSDEDVVRARLRTMGVQEYHFKFDKGMYRFCDATGSLGLEPCCVMINPPDLQYLQ